MGLFKMLIFVRQRRI